MQRSVIASWAASVALAASFSAQSPVFVLKGDAQTTRLGSDVSGAFDLNADGYDDFLGTSPNDSRKGLSTGAVYVYSGYDGTLILSVHGSQGTATFGERAALLGDVSGDGVPDILVGEKWHEILGVRHGRATVFSGVNASVVHAIDGDDPNDYFGSGVAGLGDLNGDGRCEFAVGAENDDDGGTSSGRVKVFDGASGTLLFAYAGAAGARLGTAIRSAGDVNADGTADLIVGMEWDGPGGVYSGRAQVLSGVDGALIRNFDGLEGNDHFGASVTGVGDVDQDGTPDVLVGATEFPLGVGYMEVYSGDDGALISHVDGFPITQYAWSSSYLGDVNQDGAPEYMAGFGGYAQGVHVFDGADGSILYDMQPGFGGSIGGFGVAVNRAGDVDGDGIPDLVIGASNSNHNVTSGGSVHVFSGVDLPLVSDEHLVSVFAGGVQNLELDPGVAHAGSPYLVLATAAGTNPGFSFGGMSVPLNVDALLGRSLRRNGPWSQTVGVLDGNGRATASFSIAAGTGPSLIGSRIHHAFVVFDTSVIGAYAGPAVVELVSNPVVLTIQP